ncbi:hypothetical protein ABT115_25670 [Streptomyces sp. NPDC001832]
MPERYELLTGGGGRLLVGHPARTFADLGRGTRGSLPALHRGAETPG